MSTYFIGAWPWSQASVPSNAATRVRRTSAPAFVPVNGRWPTQRFGVADQVMILVVRF